MAATGDKVTTATLRARKGGERIAVLTAYDVVFARLADEAGIDAEVFCVEARSVASGLHELGVSRRADLLVIGASRRDDYDRALVGDDTREVLGHAPCAVAVAPMGFATRPPIIELVFAVVRGDWIFAAIGVVIMILCASAIRAIRQGRNPWWLRAPLDRRDPPPS